MRPSDPKGSQSSNKCISSSSSSVIWRFLKTSRFFTRRSIYLNAVQRGSRSTSHVCVYWSATNGFISALNECVCQDFSTLFRWQAVSRRIIGLRRKKCTKEVLISVFWFYTYSHRWRNYLIAQIEIRTQSDGDHYKTRKVFKRTSELDSVRSIEDSPIWLQRVGGGSGVLWIDKFISAINPFCRFNTQSIQEPNSIDLIHINKTLTNDIRSSHPMINLVRTEFVLFVSRLHTALTLYNWSSSVTYLTLALNGYYIFFFRTCHVLFLYNQLAVARFFVRVVLNVKYNNNVTIIKQFNNSDERKFCSFVYFLLLCWSSS